MPLGSLLACFGRQPAAVNSPVLRDNTLITEENIEKIQEKVDARLKVEGIFGVDNDQLLQLLHASGTQSLSKESKRSISSLTIKGNDRNATNIMLMPQGKKGKAATHSEMLNWLYRAVLNSSCVVLPYDGVLPNFVRRHNIKLNQNTSTVVEQTKFTDGTVLYLFRAVQHKITHSSRTIPASVIEIAAEHSIDKSVKESSELVTLGWLKSILNFLDAALKDSKAVIGFDAYAVSPISSRVNYEVVEKRTYSVLIPLEKYTD